MRHSYWTVGTCLVTGVVVSGVVLDPVAAAAIIGTCGALAALFVISRERIGSFTLAAAITATVAIPSSEFSGTFRQALSIAAILILVIGYFRSSIRRPVNKAVWLAPIWLVILGLGGFTSDGLVKWIVYSALAVTGILAATRANYAPVLRWIVTLSILETVIAAMQVLTGLKLPWKQITAISGNEILGGTWLRGSGTMGHPLPLTYLLIVGFAALLRDPQWLPKPIRGAAYLVLAGGVILAGSRSGAIVLAVLILFAAGRRLNVARWIVGAFLACGVALVLAINDFFGSAYVEKIIASGSVYHRQGAFDAIGNLLAHQGASDVLLGLGYSGVPVAFARGLLQNDGFNTVDNQMVTLLATSGLIGTAIFLTFAIKALMAGNSSLRWVLLAALAMFQIFDVLLWTTSTLLFMVAAGFALSLGDKDNQPLYLRHGDQSGYAAREDTHRLRPAL